MVWQGIVAAVPGMIVALLVEKLVSMIVPAAGAVLLIIQGLQAAWGAIQRVLSAIDAFVTFLKSVKGGASGPAFAGALAASAVAVIEFIAVWLLRKLKGAATKVGGKLREIAQRIGQRLKVIAKAVVGGAKKAAGAVKRAVQAAGRAIVKGAKAVGRGIAKGAKWLEKNTGKIGKTIGRGVRAVGAAIKRGWEKLKTKLKEWKEKFDKWREERKKKKEAREQERREKAFKAVRETLSKRLNRPRSSFFIRLLLVGLKVWHRFKVLELRVTGKTFTVHAGFSPGEDVAEGEATPVAKEVNEASDSGPRYLFRGDDYYTGGPVGFVLHSDEADEADIQTPWEHVREAEGGPRKSRGSEDDDHRKTSRFTSFAISRKGAAKFTKRNKIQKALYDKLKELAAGPTATLRILEPADVEAMMLAHEKKKVRDKAADVRRLMEKNDEVLIEGQIPAELLTSAK